MKSSKSGSRPPNPSSPPAPANPVQAPRSAPSTAVGSQAGTGLDGDRHRNAHASASSEMDRQAGSPGDPAGPVPAATPGQSDRLDEQAIAARAYDLWEKGGRVHGRHEEHWHQARRELSGLPAEDLPNSGARPKDLLWTQT